MTALEERLRDALRQRVDAPVPERPPAPASHGHGRRWVVAGAVAAAVALVVLLAGGDGGPKRVVTTPATTPAPSTTAPVPPRIVLDGAEITGVTDESARRPPPTGPTGWLQLYRSPGWTPAQLLFAEVVPAEGPFDDANDTGAERRTVRGATAYLAQRTPAVTTLAVPSPGGGGVRFTGYGLGPADVVAAAETLSPPADGSPGLVAAGPIPAGLILFKEGPASPAGGDGVVVRFRLADGPTVELTLAPAGPTTLEHRLLDSMGTTTGVDAVPVLGGRAGFLVAAGPPTLLWPADGWVGELRGDVSVDRLRGLAGTLRQVDEAAWTAALPPEAVTGPEQPDEARRLEQGIPLPPGATWDGLAVGRLNPDPYGFRVDVTSYALCRWTTAWRDARSAGDTGAAGQAVDALTGAARWPAMQELSASSFDEVVASVATKLASGDAADADAALRCG